ncbi:MAG: hypothetical protein H6739_16190 [Alphaproteobacteria bacterium]|nr:hypothetical protein [Alphaproteobacteria bacterium]
MKKLEELKARTAAYNKKVEQASCPAVVEMGMIEEFAMIGEQAQMVIDAEDFGMAGDMITFLDSMEPTLDELIPMCGGATRLAAVRLSAEAPAEAPAEEAPAEAPPAEGG